MRASIAIAVAIALAGSVPGRAAADDSADTADTVMSPVTGGMLRLAEGDKRFILAVAPAYKSLRLQAQISAPLDDTTRTATFLTKRGVTPAFRGSLHIGYNSLYSTLGLEPEDAALLKYCDANHIAPCSATNVADDKYCKAHGIAPCAHDKVEAHQREARRDGQPADLGMRYWTAGLDLSYAHDQTEAYTDDIGNGMTSTFTSTDLQIGLSYVHHEPGGWVMSVRGGYERNDPVDIGEFQRCESLPSMSSSVTGQACSKARFLRGDPGPRKSWYGRVAGAFSTGQSWLRDYLSEAELRLNFENLTTDAASFDVHLLLFAKGLDVGGGKVRIGIGTTVSKALSPPPDADFITDYSLFGIAGTSF